MGSFCRSDRQDTFSVISDKVDIGFLDFENDRSLDGDEMYYDGPVLISSPFPVCKGKPQSGIVGEICADQITIKNTTNEPVELWSVKILSSNPDGSFFLSLMPPPRVDVEGKIKNFVGSTSLEDRVLQPCQILTIWLSCKPQEIGMHSAVVLFDVGDDRLERVAFLLADDNVSQALASNKPYNRAPKKNTFSVDQYVPGHRLPTPQARQFRYRLPQFTIPADLRELIEGGGSLPDVIIEGLNRKNYANFFSTLLVMEEIHLEGAMRGYSMESVQMQRRGNSFLSLVVPGLAERRPSLMQGDFIFAKLAMNGQDGVDPPLQGYIHKVEADEIYLRFANELHQKHRDSDYYNIRFTFNRTNMRRLYQAVNEAKTLGLEALFPSQCKRQVIKHQSITPLNRNINKEQLSAVQKILNCHGLPPYIIHGPPGTGKTMTIIEVVLQLMKSGKNSKVLLCAASNAAADHVLEKLLACGKDLIVGNKIFRLNASSRPYEDVKTEFISFCYLENMVFKCPPIKALLQYRIIISTYMCASLLYAKGIRRDYFSHIILDEAGQVSEPETMIPVANLCHEKTVVVLAGDPMQLGPVIFSKDAQINGLGKSYLERLFECEPYQTGNDNYVTKLVQNYRCHPAILDLPSRLFYRGELIPSKEDNDCHFYSLLDIPNKSFPVLFIGIQGCDEREGSNPSWFNRTEASKIVDFIKKLRRSADVTESDVGVISPYRQQVNKLNRALESVDMAGVKVGSVEQFQGQERRIIIISTVRSTIKYNEFDQTHHLGFLSNPKRFNVAITRAKSLLVVVGNPHIVSKDFYWNQLLRHCIDNGSYQGCPLPTLELQETIVQNISYDSQNSCNRKTEGYGKQQEAEWEDYVTDSYSNVYRSGEHISSSWDDELSGNGSVGYENGDESECDPKKYCNDGEWCEDSNRISHMSGWADKKSEPQDEELSIDAYDSSSSPGYAGIIATGWD